MIRTALAVTLLVTTALAATNGTAYAVPYAYSSNDISNFSLTAVTGSYRSTNAPDDTGTSTNTSTYGEVSNNTIRAAALDTMANADQAMSGPGPFPSTDNYVANAGRTAGMNGARGDSWTQSGNGQTTAEVRLASGGPGASSGKVSSSFGITITTNTTLRFDFVNNIVIEAATDALAGQSANAAVATVYTIANAQGQIIFTFAPDGSGPGAIQGGTATSNPFNLQATVGSAGGFPADVTLANTAATDRFTAITNVLTAGNYLVTLRSTSQVDAQQGFAAVPEPASIALLGMGLLGAGLLCRRT